MIEIIDWQEQFFDFAILSGLQIDRFGNLNSVCVGPHQRPNFRGPGVVGISALTALSKRFYILAPRHDVGCFVPKVHFISGAGYLDGGDSRENAGLSGGPALVVSPLGVFDFAPGTRSMRVRSIHPGKSLQEVQAATGFELDISLGIQETVPPTEAELHVLRTQVDVAGALRSL